MMQGREPGKPTEMNISVDGIHYRSSLSESKIAWPSISNWIEAKDVFVLYLTPVSFFPIPKRAMTTEQQNEFREMLRQYVKAK